MMEKKDYHNKEVGKERSTKGRLIYCGSKSETYLQDGTRMPHGVPVQVPESLREGLLARTDFREVE